MADMIKGFSVNGEEYKVDYNSLGNKPFGVDTWSVVFPSTDIETSGSDPAESSGFDIEYSAVPQNGDVCAVTFDGVEYEVTAIYYSHGMGGLILGELAELDNEIHPVFDNYPFFIKFYKNSNYEYSLYLETDTAGIFNVSVKKKDKTRIPLSAMPNELDVRNTYEIFISADNLQFTDEGEYYQAQLFDGSKFVEAGGKYRVTIGSYSTELYSKLNQISGSENNSFRISTNPSGIIMVSPDFYNEYHPTSVVIEKIIPNKIPIAKNAMVYAWNGGDGWGQYMTIAQAINRVAISAGCNFEFYDNKEQCDAINN